jgi:hypothetical protein
MKNEQDKDVAADCFFSLFRQQSTGKFPKTRKTNSATPFNKHQIYSIMITLKE